MNSKRITEIRKSIQIKENEIMKLRYELSKEEDKENRKRYPEIVGKCYIKTDFCDTEHLKVLSYDKKHDQFNCLTISINHKIGDNIHYRVSWAQYDYDIIDDYRPSTQEDFDNAIKKLAERLPKVMHES